MSLADTPGANPHILDCIDALALSYTPDVWASQLDGQAPVVCEATQPSSSHFAAQSISINRSELPENSPHVEFLLPVLAQAVGSYVFYNFEDTTGCTTVARTSFMSPDGETLRRSAVVIREEEAWRRTLTVDRLEPYADAEDFVAVDYQVEETDTELLDAAYDLFMAGYGDEKAFYKLLQTLECAGGSIVCEDDLLALFPEYCEMGEVDSIRAMWPAVSRQIERDREQARLATEIPELVQVRPADIIAMTGLVQRLL